MENVVAQFPPEYVIPGATMNFIRVAGEIAPGGERAFKLDVYSSVLINKGSEVQG